MEKSCCKELVEAMAVDVGVLFHDDSLCCLCCVISITADGLLFFGR